MLDSQPCHFFCCHSFLTRNEQGCFTAIMIHYSEYGVISLCYRQFSDEVQGNGFKWHSFVCGEYRLQWCLGGSRVDFVPLTLCTPFHIILNVLMHIGPPVLLAC